ncbi:MAG TPA: tetratricopeptide repeat protein [Tepidisphaeraceae bacterium]|nr:tetratricopeptide repeat protein [Tepidisphaeraceae bacterium]
MGSASGKVILKLVLAGCYLHFLAGCAANPQSVQQLDAAKQAVAGQQYDQAIRDADAVIASGDSGGLAEAYYLRGYCIEVRPKSDPAASARDSAMARDSYLRGLSQNPRPAVAARLRAQLGNVAYYQNDFSTALRELSDAYRSVGDPAAKPLILYHMGICEQRLGRFEDADRTFQRVQQDYPGSEYAAHARAHEGIRGFYVQLGAYSRQSDINEAAGAVAAVGSAPLKTTDGNLTVIRTADVPSYEQAEQLKARLAGRYPDARVMP